MRTFYVVYKLYTGTVMSEVVQISGIVNHMVMAEAIRKKCFQHFPRKFEVISWSEEEYE